MNAPFRHKVSQDVVGRSPRAFTLIELLVVITIIGLLLGLGLPMIKGMNKSNSMIAADRQLLDDINYARQRAIGDHTSVYMVFVPPTVINWTVPTDPALSKSMINLYGGQYTIMRCSPCVLSVNSRAAPRRIISPPGGPCRPAFISPPINSASTPVCPGLAPTFFFNSVNHPEFPFPVATNFAAAKNDFALPHFGFNYLGQVIYRSNSVDHLVYTQGDAANHMYIPLARGSLFYQRNADGTYAAQGPDIAETQPGAAYYANYNSTNVQGGAPLPVGSNSYNQIYIDPLTGRAKVQRLQIQ